MEGVHGSLEDEDDDFRVWEEQIKHGPDFVVVRDEDFGCLG